MKIRFVFILVLVLSFFVPVCAPADAINPVATVIMADGSEITLELYPDIAPNTVANFVTLAESGFYDGLIFHRIIPGFMIQGGDPAGTGAGGPGYSIRGEFSENGFKNDLRHMRGVISMARTMDMNSAGSQFFIMHDDAPFLDGNYAAFGKVIEGIEAVDAIAGIATGNNDRPLNTEHCTIQKITVDAKGVQYSVIKTGEP